MANLDEMTAAVIREGYSQANAVARVCQDVVLKAISQSHFSDHMNELTVQKNDQTKSHLHCLRLKLTNAEM